MRIDDDGVATAAATTPSLVDAGGPDPRHVFYITANLALGNTLGSACVRVPSQRCI